MGVCCLVLWDYPEGLNPSQALDVMQKRLEILGSIAIGQWIVDCEVMQSTTALGSSGKTVQLIHCNEFPRTTFAVTDSYHCLVADSSLDTIFSHLKPIYTAKKPQKIEAKGFRHEVNDKYIVKFATLTYASSSKGIIVEVEDKVNSTVSTAWGRLTDFTRSLLHSAEQIQLPSHVERSQDGQYLPADSIVNYALIFNQLRKPGGAVGR